MVVQVETVLLATREAVETVEPVVLATLTLGVVAPTSVVEPVGQQSIVL